MQQPLFVPDPGRKAKIGQQIILLPATLLQCEALLRCEALLLPPQRA